MDYKQQQIITKNKINKNDVYNDNNQQNIKR